MSKPDPRVQADDLILQQIGWCFANERPDLGNELGRWYFETDIPEFLSPKEENGDYMVWYRFPDGTLVVTEMKDDFQL